MSEEVQKFATIVIGAGPGGLAAAHQLASQQDVLVIEDDLWGGTCPNRGCDPKKMLYSAVEARDRATYLQGHGLEGAPTIDWPKLMTFKRAYTEKVPAGTLNGLKAAGITTIQGKPYFISENQLKVNGQVYEGHHFIIATGQTPVIPGIPGHDYLQTSTDFLDLDQLPARIAFVGGGYVAIELANIAANAGAEVHLLQHNQRILRDFPENYTQLLATAMSDHGVNFHWDTELESVSEIDDGLLLTTNQGSLEVDAVFAAIGRRPQLDSLNLQAAKVDVAEKGLRVNGHLQTTNPRIYGIGDVLLKKQPKLTPVASFEGRYVASDILGKTTAPIDYPSVPQVVYASPQIAQTGVKVEDAKNAPDQYLINAQDTTQWYTFNRIKDPIARVTTVIDKQTQLIVGAVVYSTLADELINDLNNLINNQTTVTQLQRQIPAYPTAASDLVYYY